MTYDFIIVGSGPAGATIAHRLAATSQKPSVLLLEAGDGHLGKESRLGLNRWMDFHTAAERSATYESVPQKQLAGRQVSLRTGRALGGGTSINIGFWTVGSAGDYDWWAKKVGDPSFEWSNVHRCLRRLESTGPMEAPELQHFYGPKPSSHGTDGEVRVEFADTAPKQTAATMEAFVDYGIPINPDVNSGEPIGIGLIPATTEKSYRVTAASAHLQEQLDNLHIKTGATVKKIIFEGTRAVAVSVGDETFSASKEIIISAGAIHTPQLLMVSGIGPKVHLAEVGISALVDLPVGETLRDHFFVPLAWEVKPGFSDSINWLYDPDTYETHRKQFLDSETGLFKDFYANTPIAFLRDAAVAHWPETASLPADVQAHVRDPRVPTAELVPCVPIGAISTKLCLRLSVFPFATQSTGSVRLASASLEDAPLVDPSYLSSPFDRKNTIETMRTALRIIRGSSLAGVLIEEIMAPKSDAENDILDYVKEVLVTGWHYGCSVKMAQANDGSGCVDSNFRVFGTSGLRVADLSVPPVHLQCHFQAVGYVIGEIMAEKLVEQYKLEA